MAKPRRLIVAITGATGFVYGARNGTADDKGARFAAALDIELAVKKSWAWATTPPARQALSAVFRRSSSVARSTASMRSSEWRTSVKPLD